MVSNFVCLSGLVSEARTAAGQWMWNRIIDARSIRRIGRIPWDGHKGNQDKTNNRNNDCRQSYSLPKNLLHDMIVLQNNS